jgi:hypothetical protein
MPLAPPITKENAAEYARRATIARELNRAVRNGQHANLKPELSAQARAQVQVNKVLKWMEKERDFDKYAQLAAVLDRLWNKAYSTQGSQRPPKNRDRSPSAIPIEETPETPQEPIPPASQP